MSKVEAELIEISTCGQSVNPKWLQAREGRITASQFGPICKMRPTTPPDNVVREIKGYKRKSNGSLRSKAAPLQWGSQHESIARERDIKFMKKKGHKRLTVMERGLVGQSDLPILVQALTGLYTALVVGSTNDCLKLSVLINGVS